MKTGTSTHKKSLRLCRALDMQRWQVVGILETIWEMTAQKCPEGDLGTYDNVDIAEHLGWPKDDIDRLIEILIDEKWLDRVDNPEVRFVVHDWKEHCPEWVKKQARKKRNTKGLEENASNSEIPTKAAIARGQDTKAIAIDKTIPPISPKLADWIAFCQRFRVMEKYPDVKFKEIEKLNSHELGHLWKIVFKGFPNPVNDLSALSKSLAKKRGPGPEAMRIVRAWFDPPPEPGKCHCGGDLEFYDCPGSGQRGHQCRSCKKNYPAR